MVRAAMYPGFQNWGSFGPPLPKIGSVNLHILKDKAEII